MKTQATANEVEDIVKLLQAVFTVTGSLLESCRDGDLERTEELLNEREHLLHRAAEIRESVRSHPADSVLRQEVQGRILPLLQAIQQGNEEFLGTLTQKRKETLEGLQQVENRKSFLAYAR